jgi:hypothetical protein
VFAGTAVGGARFPRHSAAHLPLASGFRPHARHTFPSAVAWTEVPFCVTTDDSTTSRSRLLHNRRYFSGPSQPSCGASERRPTRPGFFSAPHNPPRPPPIPEWPHPRLHRCRRPRGRHRPPRTLAAREAGRRSRRP